MKGTLTSQGNEPDTPELPIAHINENDPKQLRQVISHLIGKSKAIVETLEGTVARLEKAELERDYWRQSYLRFRQACQKYIDADGLQHYEHITQLEDELKRAEAEKQCRAQQRGMCASYVDREKEHKYSMQRGTYNERSTDLKDVSSTRRKRRMQKSISTVSFNKEISQSEHRIAPKKINLVKPKAEVYLTKV